jgi:TonB family protein
MPNWIPAKHKGKTVSCIMNIPLNFRLDSKPVEAASVLISAGKTTLMDPAFPGDPFKFLRENIKYPATAKAAKAEGMVIVKFVVKEDGSLTGIEQANPDKPLHPDLVIEAIRVVSAMPNWKPGMKEGKVVQMEYMLPIKFKLDKKSPE